jgi:SAM-dependent methyltransferase
MNPAEYDRMYSLEDRYWWFVSRRELVLSIIRRLALPHAAAIVDVGCGTGATAEALSEIGSVACVDISSQALDYCRQRGLTNLIEGRAENLPLESGSADLVVALDILEHLDDDSAALRDILRVLKPGGRFVATVPAYRMLWSEHDVALAHKRRYTSGELAMKMRNAGFCVDALSYALWFLFPLALLQRTGRRKPVSGEAAQAQVPQFSSAINTLLIKLQRIENAIMRHIPLPWGVSVVCVARKPE